MRLVVIGLWLAFFGVAAWKAVHGSWWAVFVPVMAALGAAFGIWYCATTFDRRGRK